MNDRLLGADAAGVAEIGRRMGTSAQTLRTIRTTLRARLHSTPWVGEGAERFRADWDGSHGTALLRAIEALEGASIVLRDNAAEQDDASADRGGLSRMLLPGTAALGGLAERLRGRQSTPGGSTELPSADPKSGGDSPGVAGGAKFVVGPPTKPPFAFDDDFPYDPNAVPTAADRVSWAKWQAQLKGADVIRPDLDDALQTYRHYTHGSGTPLIVDYEEAYREDPNIRTAVDAEVRSAQEWAERIARDTEQTSFTISGDGSSVNALGGYPSTENWQKTLGDHQIWSSADVRVDGDTVTMTIRVNAEDRYDFNKGAADIATQAPDDANGRFAVLGWAKPFDTHGELERTVTWTIGDAAGTETADPGLPARNPGREDREDGLGSSSPLRPIVPDDDRATGGIRVW